MLETLILLVFIEHETLRTLIAFFFERFHRFPFSSTKGQTSIGEKISGNNRYVHMKASRLADTPPRRVDGIRFHVTSSRRRLSRDVSSHLVTIKRSHYEIVIELPPSRV